MQSPQLDPDRNDLSQNIGIQVDHLSPYEGKNSTADIIQSISKWKDDLSNFDPAGFKEYVVIARQAFQANLENENQLSVDAVDVQDVMLTVSAPTRYLIQGWGTIKKAKRNQPEQPEQPEEPL